MGEKSKFHGIKEPAKKTESANSNSNHTVNIAEIKTRLHHAHKAGDRKLVKQLEDELVDYCEGL